MNDHNSVLARQSEVYSAIQLVILIVLGAKILYLSHYPRLVGHPRARSLYNTLHKEFYWPHIGNGICKTVSDCWSRVIQGTRHCQQNEWWFFLLVSPNYIAIAIHSSHLRTRYGNQYVLVSTECKTKLTSAIFVTKVTSTSTAFVLVDYWVIPYDALTHQLNNNWPQLVYKFFAVYEDLRLQYRKKNSYYLQTSGQKEQVRKTFVARLHQYVTKYQTNWDQIVQPLTKAYNSQVHHLAWMTSVSLLSSRRPPGLAEQDPPFSIPTDLLTPPHRAPFASQAHFSEIPQASKSIYRTHENARTCHIGYSDKIVCVTPPFQTGQYVFFDHRPKQITSAALLAHEPRCKPLSKPVGPLCIVSITPDTVTIDRDSVQNTVSINRLIRASDGIDPTNETNKRKIHENFPKAPSFGYHTITEGMKPGILLKGPSGISEPAIMVDMSCTGTSTSNLSIGSIFLTKYRNTLVRNLGTADVVNHNRQKLTKMGQLKNAMKSIELKMDVYCRNQSITVKIFDLQSRDNNQTFCVCMHTWWYRIF